MTPMNDYPWLMRVQAEEAEAIAVIDDAPVWSAPFGEALMSAVRLAPGLRVLDVGCGLGYPLLELAGRLGPSARCVGLDPWRPALERARLKAQVRGLEVGFRLGAAEAMPFEDGAFGLVLSNNGLNNVADPAKALAECFRVSAPGAQFLMTANLPETFGAFYGHFEAALEQAGHGDRIEALRAHRAAKRLSAEAWFHLVSGAGFSLEAQTHHAFAWRVLDGAALFAHPAFRLSFVAPWITAVGEAAFQAALPDLLQRLDGQALACGGLDMEVPFLLLEARKG